jgi:tight adherence protein B
MVKDDLADPTSDRIIEVLILAHQRGGRAIPEILADLAEAVSKDLWTIEQVRTDILEQKINSRVVFVMPWVVLVAMTARSTAFREFYSTRAGLLVVALGGVLSIVGMVIASKLGAQPAEPRVFAGGRST